MKELEVERLVKLERLREFRKRRQVGPSALHVSAVDERRRPKRAVVYDDHVLEPPCKVWAVLGGPCGKRLAPFMGEIVAALERHGKLDVADDVRARLLAISPATIDRVFAPERRRLEVKGTRRDQAREPPPEPDPDPHLRLLG